MIHYRKSGSREFFKVNDETGIVIRVLNKHKVSLVSMTLLSKIDIVMNNAAYGDAFEDSETKPSTEEEFTSAYNEALERITTGKI